MKERLRIRPKISSRISSKKNTTIYESSECFIKRMISLSIKDIQIEITSIKNNQQERATTIKSYQKRIIFLNGLLIKMGKSKDDQKFKEQAKREVKHIGQLIEKEQEKYNDNQELIEKKEKKLKKLKAKLSK